MEALIASVFLASLLGSTHCAGMCGAFVAFATGLDDPSPTARRRLFALHSAYNAGRLVVYCVLGALAGTIGSVLDVAGSMAGVSRVAAALAGGVLVVFGSMHLFRALGWRSRTISPPAVLQRALRKGHRLAMMLPPVRRAFAIGLMTTLLPCGWLYAFVAAAAGTGSGALGVLTMAVFWAGTLPMMVAVGTGVRALAGPLASRLPVLMPALVILAGLLTIFSRLGVSPQALAKAGGHMEQMNLEQMGSEVDSLDPAAMPCCNPAESMEQTAPPVAPPAAPKSVESTQASELLMRVSPRPKEPEQPLEKESADDGS